MNIFVSKNRVINPLSIPITCLAFAMLFLCALSYFVKVDVELVSSLSFSAICPAFVVHYYTNDYKLSLALSFCIALSNALIYNLCNAYLGYGAIVLLSVAICFICKGFSLKNAFVFGFFAVLVFVITCYVSYPYIKELFILLARTFSKKPTLFGIVNNAYSMLFDSSISNLIYYKSYGSASFQNGELVVGVANAFSVLPRKASEFQTGQYFANIFLPAGVFFALYSRIKDNYFLPFAFSLILSTVFGVNSLFCTFLFFFNPFVFFGYLFTVGCSYLVPRLMNLSIGFKHSASLIELFKYGNNWVYFILVGVLLAVLMYFVCTFVLSRYDLSSKRYFPREVRTLVEALGGEKNIVKINNGRLYVVNPNLINVLRVDCEINSNEITLIDTELNLLIEHFG